MLQQNTFKQLRRGVVYTQVWESGPSWQAGQREAAARSQHTHSQEAENHERRIPAHIQGGPFASTDLTRKCPHSHAHSAFNHCTLCFQSFWYFPLGPSLTHHCLPTRLLQPLSKTSRLPAGDTIWPSDILGFHSLVTVPRGVSVWAMASASQSVSLPASPVPPPQLAS